MKIPKRKRGKLFVLEGPDGVGKTSISESVVEIAEALRAGFSVYVVFLDAKMGSLGRLVYDLHHSSLFPSAWRV
jgi:thymidylate kinase